MESVKQIAAFDLDNLVRNNIKNLQPYSSARTEFKGQASVFLDANENSFGSPAEKDLNRYPDPYQWKLKFELAKIKGVPAENIFVGNGSDEVIDLAFRIFCNPGKDNVIICPPTYGMYEVSAHINDVEVRKVSLTPDYQLDVEAILKAADTQSKLLFICSPNNPTGNDMNRGEMEVLLQNFKGLVVIDEAYINFSRQASMIRELTKYPNLLVMQTLSKAWGLAGLRLGIAYGSEKMIDWLNKVKPPYNVNAVSQQIGTEAMQKISIVNNWIRNLISEREKLAAELWNLALVEEIYESAANFILVKVNNADDVYQHLTKNGIVVRNRNRVPLCEGCLRITVGTESENRDLLKALENYRSQEHNL